MTKSINQIPHAPIKKESTEDQRKLNQILHDTNNTTKNKIAKYKISKTKVVISPRFTLIKSKDADNPEQTSSLKTLKRRRIVSNEQIENLINYIVNEKMGISAASKKAKISISTAHSYYQEYKDDPECKIPLSRTISNKQDLKVTQEKIDNLIHYVINQKMSIAQAAKKAHIYRKTAVSYYKKYLEDPERRVPKLYTTDGRVQKLFTKEQINEVINYIVHDGMTVAAASKKANMADDTVRKYYLKYLYHPRHKIPLGRKANYTIGRSCTNNQVKKLIDYVVGDKMSLLEASVKADMNMCTASKYYNQYLDDPNHEIPTPETSNNNRVSNKPVTPVQVKIFFGFLIVDKLNVEQASRKANISERSGNELYRKYLKKPTKEIDIKDNSYSVKKMKKFVDYIQIDKMPSMSAAIKACLSYSTAVKYYHQYLKDPQKGIPEMQTGQYTRERLKELFEYIETNKVSVSYAARKLRMGYKAAQKYYTLYQNDPDHKIPLPAPNRYTVKCKTFNKYTKIISELYKKKSSIKSMDENHHLDLDQPIIDVKVESMEEDSKTMLEGQNK